MNRTQDQLDDRAVDSCIERVVTLLQAAETEEKRGSPAGRRQAKRLAQVATNESVADLTMALADEVLRIEDRSVAARRFHDVVGKSTLIGFGFFDRLLLRLGALIAPKLPQLVMPLVSARLRAETSQTILDARPEALNVHHAKRVAQGRKLNFNRLGEAILGNDEADRRLNAVLELIARPTTTNVSVKASSVVANLSVLSYDRTVDRVVDAFRKVFLAAAEHSVFVNIDMEEYRDLRLTADAFMAVLQEPNLRSLYAGIVLQAYVPDSHGVAVELGEWAKLRVAGNTGNAGNIGNVGNAEKGAPIRIRLVKGANLAMEHVDAEMHGWNAATYSTKADVDASWKRLLDTLLNHNFAEALHVGIASHNLFDVAWALHLQERLPAGQHHRISFEMLEGMAESQAKAVRAMSGNLLMYAPIVEPTDFVAAIGYLTRRLDENTAPENFLRALFDLAPGSPTFTREALRFRTAVHHRHQVATKSFREEPLPPTNPGFSNAPDSDFTQPEIRSQLLTTVATASLPNAAPLVHSTEEVDAVVASAKAATGAWAGKQSGERARLLRSVGSEIAKHREAIIATIVADAAKTIAEADPEVSEAIDFANFYADRAEEIGATSNPNPMQAYDVRSEPLGVVVVAPPWNFAYAIAMGGVLAALAAGNTVILKPAPQAPRTAKRVAMDCWAAGIPTDALQLLAVPDDAIGRHLISHPNVDAVILTGGLATAQMFLAWKPSLRLLAETSGKNSLIITASADLDLAIKDLVKSAFGHGGQKCSAASLAIVEASVFDDPSFSRRLGDAVRTLRCGESTDPATDIAPLIENPSPSLQRALTMLDRGETWLVQPHRYRGDDDNQAWSPGVRMGVAEGSWFHRTECFGPVLGVMRARDLHHGIALQNATEFGLTAGIHALDPAIVEKWKGEVAAGNLYVNRSITGAIVNRQPFGGWKSSTIGATAKAGGPNYLTTLRRWFPGNDLPESENLESSGKSASFKEFKEFDEFELCSVFGRELAALFNSQSDPSGLRSESNILRYRSLPRGVLLRIGPSAPKDTQQLAQCAATATNCPLTVSSSVEESEEVCSERLRNERPDRLRVVGDCTDALRHVANTLGIRIDEAPLVGNASVEVTRWAREQAVSTTMHRHGRLLR